VVKATFTFYLLDVYIVNTFIYTIWQEGHNTLQEVAEFLNEFTAATD
jgi:hypothetical protein